MHISSAFDSGNIEVIDSSDPKQIELKIARDAGEDHYQWFHFRVTGARGVELTMRLTNAGKVSYPTGWDDYQVCVSYDRETWFRVPTSFDGRTLTIEHTPEADSAYFAYFAPYSLERHADLIAEAQCAQGVRYERLGATVDGRDIDLLVVGDTSDAAQGSRRSSGSGERLACWVIARQHPGESMAEWLVEGLLERLLDEEDAVARAIRRRATLYIVPNMNPDGSFRGHLRNNAVGANLNREWEEPGADKSPEVFFVRAKMQQTGVDFFLDVHGDEALAYNFISGAEGTPSWSDAFAARQQRYVDALLAASPDFQTVQGYPVPDPGDANMAMASNWVSEHFKCLAMTLEQPFKDTADTPHPLGWSPDRCRKFGHAQLDALRAVLDHLKS